MPEASTQNETINGVVILFYKNYINNTPKRYTNAYGLARTLAKRFNEQEKFKRLEEIYRYTNIGYPLGLIESVAYRDLSLGRNLGHAYNYGYQQKPALLGDLIVTLDTCLFEIFDIFTEMCIEHNIDPNLITPDMFLPTRTEGSL